MAPTATSVHHHRSTTKSDHKPFKSKFASKSALKDKAKGKIETQRPEKGQRKTPHQQVMSKLARRNQAKQLRMSHKDKRDGEENIFQGADGAAKHIAIVPLSTTIDSYSAIKVLNESVDVPGPESSSGTVPVRIDRFRRNLLYLPGSFDLLKSLDVCKLADWVVFVLGAEQTFGEEEDMFLRALEGQGITNVTAVVQDLDAKVPAAKRSRHLTDLKIAIGRYFPALDKLSSLDSKSDCSNLVRSMCTASTRGIRWRDDRSWMLLENVNWSGAADEADTTTVTVSGFVRGKGMNPDRLVHVPGWGDFQIEVIRELPKGQKRKADEMDADVPIKEWRPTEDQDDLAELAPEQAEMHDIASTAATTEHKGVLLDDYHYFSDDNSHIPATPKKLPKGTSDYQAAWYLDDVSDSDSDMLDEDNDGDVAMDADSLGPEDGVVANSADAMTEGGPSEYPESEMHVDADDEEEARQLEEYRTNKKKEAEDDLEFPDEIELNPEMSGRERLAKYRGLKSLRTSEWNHAEDAPYEPFEYKRLLQIADYKKSYSASLKESLGGGVIAGTKVEVQLRNVPVSLASSPPPACMFSLLRHEHKHAVINLNMTLSSDLEAPLKSKEEVIVQIGHRRLTINPIFSASGNTPNDVHKFDRYIHPGRTAIATFTGPMTWGSVPVLVFRRETPAEDDAPALVDSTKPDAGASQGQLKLIGTATTIAPSSARVIAKRAILTGHPLKIHKKLVTVRYMFFNREDVLWFAALPLWTKRGRQGFIKEPLGTHGYFKATFDGKINPMDAIGVSLYKRVWPRPAKVLE
ncbi:ribosome biogenesis protein tsr1 [Elasticomyces elasticus]|uniref:Ribosome biogenesis protein tsr1 n=1 Tax=Exophiala sideris TaxID=1016849 RepID=A0ABR0JRY9_9EURO|nr:ribosome biogenesis protein tsr1 [Elasticomyces elasticus]KAK5039708.1 ribosome biogenesis protein tsr1 [Exophiala sideris]KAK5041260.1 ribosome biogenesis protein tsr1 [Exophiala sideris]KAK5068086.1 ribosome biogenesis protein tsr1 [Exophiala sideris]KAK5187387.1 ribosome biogenesis protein tsr1 [Eurotiomycetes sp. CCFEE 6388]